MLGVQGSFPDDWAGAIGMNDGFDPFRGLGFPDISQMPVLPSSLDLDLDEIQRAMEEYGSGSAGRGMSAHNMVPLWPILNMPPASPSTTEKRGRDEGEEDDVDQPPLQRRRHQDAPPRKERSDKGKKRDQPAPQRRGVQNAAPRKVRSDKGKKRGPRSA
jgi:hypothetical protein